jgi:hypothetical protein
MRGIFNPVSNMTLKKQKSQSCADFLPLSIFDLETNTGSNMWVDAEDAQVFGELKERHRFVTIVSR